MSDYTGMRPAELAFLTWNDIDFTMRTVNIQAKESWQPKTSQERIIPLSNEALDIVSGLYNAQKIQWVFSHGERPGKSIRKALATAAHNSDIKHVTPNMLRHTFATHLLMEGANIEAVRQLSGHTNLKTTTKYSHAISEHLRHTINKLDKTKTPTFRRQETKIEATAHLQVVDL